MALPKNPKVDLKTKYRRYLEICMILSLGLMIIAFKYFPEVKKTDIKLEGPQELVIAEDVEVTKQESAPPPPPKPPIPIEAPSDDVLEDIEIMDAELDVTEEVTAPPPPPPSEEEEEEEEEPAFFVAVEEMPTPIGGIGAIQKNITYPEIAKRAGVQGRVFVKAYVDESGNVQKVELIKGIGAGCDEEAMAAVKKAKFKPGKQRGKPVRVQVSIPVLFKLQ